MANLDSILKSRNITLPTKAHLVNIMFFPVVIHVWVWEVGHKESWAPDNWCFWTVVLEKTLESPLNCKGIQPVNSKDNQSWIFIGRTDAEAEAPIIWPLDVKNWLTGKDPIDGKDQRQDEKWMTEDVMFGWHHQLDGQEFEQVLRAGDRQVNLAYCRFMGSQRVRHDWVTGLYWTELIGKVLKFSPERHSKY